MTTDTTSQASGHGPLRRLVGSAIALLQTRLELVGIELAEEKERLMGVLFLGLAAMMLATMALISLTVLIAIAFWDTYRWQSLAGITALYAIGGIVCALKARSGLHDAPTVFDATLAELEKDRELFRGKS
ncbi:phage holin family protein [Burkholderia multivorans]|uniref:phage holin family protein n=1 Tax=Burkholderia multivorans TaxID=87883 RepID=UPI0020193869|nr:phage holin family protein [Burkholderia multivorans]MCO1462285.1 phage holin family protein [Burkholderia multivorans]UQN68726.1 phage holin family protein [Burkholderia multivorans]UQN74453.1 phage holin family protein [Burkholderia multivorans]